MRYFLERPRRSRKSPTLIVLPFRVATFASTSGEDGRVGDDLGRKADERPGLEEVLDEAGDDLRLRPERLGQVEVPGRLEPRLAPRLLDPLREAPRLVGHARRRRAGRPRLVARDDEPLRGGQRREPRLSRRFRQLPGDLPEELAAARRRASGRPPSAARRRTRRRA